MTPSGRRRAPPSASLARGPGATRFWVQLYLEVEPPHYLQVWNATDPQAQLGEPLVARVRWALKPRGYPDPAKLEWHARESFRD